jgi:hypothetical protein
MHGCIDSRLPAELKSFAGLRGDTATSLFVGGKWSSLVLRIIQAQDRDTAAEFVPDCCRLPRSVQGFPS